ncbi:dnaJ homolog subfamily B member 6-like isoform X2 [Chenopodium quinoa]|uniref:dnaJ homolog subfamily B member 6-like isoform X2 n=1 Tax=Chenopodium quinoa TaxID=63459 RepID=UPI000B77922E|nr:dnaJ homolog subfamily B member 6-like isoform X2 [Chenopodium quinoa]
MADGGERNSVDFYKILGLEKECSPTDLKNAYKKLAKRWHPDRCSASGNSKFVEEANKKFQAIQEAYSVLSDETKRFLYDVGVYDNDDDENNNENGEESFEQLQELFEDMFQRDSCDAFASTSSQGMNSSGSSSYGSSIEGSCINNKRNSVGMNRTDASSSFNDINFESFCLGMDCRGDSRRIKGTIARTQGGGGSNCSSNRDNSRRRYGRKQKIAPGHDVSSNDYSGIST